MKGIGGERLDWRSSDAMREMWRGCFIEREIRLDNWVQFDRRQHNEYCSFSILRLEVTPCWPALLKCG